MTETPLHPTAPPRLYPAIPTEGNGNSYRLQQITRIQAELAREAEKRAGLCKKYKRGVNIVDGVDTTLVAVGAGFGVGGAALLSTIVAIPIALGLEFGSLGCAGLSVVGKVVGRRLTAKHDKHRHIEAIARAKLNTLSDIISKALVDGDISDAEYGLVLREVQKFETLKETARAKKAMPSENIDALKKQLLAESRKEALAELTKKLNSS